MGIGGIPLHFKGLFHEILDQALFGLLTRMAVGHPASGDQRPCYVFFLVSSSQLVSSEMIEKSIEPISAAMKPLT